MKQKLPTNMKLVPVLSMVLVGMILIISQPQLAFAGACPDNGESDPEWCLRTPVEDIENLIADVEELVEDGNFDINNGQTNSIIKKLEKAIDKVESEHINAAIGSLNAFINQIEAFINSESISAEDGQTLIAITQNIIDYLALR